MWDSQDLAKEHAEEAEDVASMPRTMQTIPRTLQTMPRMLQSMPRTAEDVAKHAQELSSMPTHIETWWYTTPLTSQLIRQQVGGFFFDVGLLGPCEKACRGCLGRCKACLGRCEACRGRPRTLPSMPRSCQASLHILGSHNIYIYMMFHYIKLFISCKKLFIPHIFQIAPRNNRVRFESWI